MLLDRVFEFECSTCRSTYKVVRSPGPYIASAKVLCLVCKHSLPLETDILKYFLLSRGPVTKPTRGGHSVVADTQPLSD